MYNHLKNLISIIPHICFSRKGADLSFFFIKTVAKMLSLW